MRWLRRVEVEARITLMGTPGQNGILAEAGESQLHAANPSRRNR
jgi:hypothetical protein